MDEWERLADALTYAFITNNDAEVLRLTQCLDALCEKREK
jgi:hypothetical protein